MDASADSSLVEAGVLGAVRVPASAAPSKDPRTSHHIYYKAGDVMVRIYNSEDINITGACARNERFEYAHEHKLAPFERLKCDGRTDLCMVRVGAVDVVRSMLGVESGAVDRRNHRKVVQVLRKAYKPAEGGPVSPLTYISYDETTKTYTWTKTGTTHLWHLQFGNVAFVSPLRALRVMRTQAPQDASKRASASKKAPKGPKDKDAKPRMTAFKLFHPKPPIINLSALLKAAKTRMGEASKPTPAAAAPPVEPVAPLAPFLVPVPVEPPTIQAPVAAPVVEPAMAAPKPPRPTTGGKTAVSCARPERLSASASFAPAASSSTDTSSSSDSESASDANVPMPDVAVGNAIADGTDMCDSEADDQSESEESSDDEGELTVAIVRMPVSDNEEILGLKRSAAAITSAYRRKLQTHGSTGLGTPETLVCSDDYDMAHGLLSQVEALSESLQRGNDQIASCERMLSKLYRKRKLDAAILHELETQLELAQQTCNLPSDTYVIKRYEQLKRNEMRQGKQEQHARRGKFAKSS